MDIRALVLVKTVAGAVVEPIQLSPLSPALLEVVGRSPLQRTVARLRNSGIQATKIISDSDFLPSLAETNGDGASHHSAGQERFWRAAETAFNELVQDGAELVLLVSLDHYAE